jgi:hypothetical protein
MRWRGIDGDGRMRTCRALRELAAEMIVGVDTDRQIAD